MQQLPEVQIRAEDVMRNTVLGHALEEKSDKGSI